MKPRRVLTVLVCLRKPARLENENIVTTVFDRGRFGDRQTNFVSFIVHFLSLKRFYFSDSRIGARCLEMNIDHVLVSLGMGRYQLVGCILFGFAIMFSAISPVTYVFTAGDLKYR